MEALKKTYDQYAAIFSSLPGSQRLSLILVAALVIGGLGFIVYNNSSTAYVPASYNAPFSADEMKNARALLSARGLNDFKEEGNKLMVPRADVARYNAALLEGGGLPHDWGSELEKQFEKDGWFPSDRQSQNRKDIALAKALRAMIVQMPAVSEASVIWARSKPRRFSGSGSKVTATVSVKPKGGQEITPQIVQSIRSAVASSISDLSADDVTILNQQTGIAYTKSSESPFDGEYISWIKQFTEMYKGKVESQLSFIPDVLVTVDVRSSDIKSLIERKREVDPKKKVPTMETSRTIKDTQNETALRGQPGEVPNQPLSLPTANSGGKTRKLEDSTTTTETMPSVTDSLTERIAAKPETIKISVAVPEEYFTKALEKAGAGGNGSAGQGNASTRESLTENIKQLAAQAAGLDPAGTDVTVAPYVRVDKEMPELETPFTETAMSLLSQWGGPVALGFFALWALWMVRKNMPKIPEVKATPLPSLVKPQLAEEIEEPVEEKKAPAAPTQRDRLQGVVRENPEMAAAVLSQWLKAAG